VITAVWTPRLQKHLQRTRHDVATADDDVVEAVNMGPMYAMLACLRTSRTSGCERLRLHGSSSRDAASTSSMSRLNCAHTHELAWGQGFACPEKGNDRHGKRGGGVYHADTLQTSVEGTVEQFRVLTQLFCVGRVGRRVLWIVLAPRMTCAALTKHSPTICSTLTRLSEPAILGPQPSQAQVQGRRGVSRRALPAGLMGTLICCT